MLSMGRARALVHQYTRNDKVYRRCLFLLEFREDFIRRGDKVSGLVDCQSDEMFVIVASVVSTHSLRVKTGNKQSQIDDHKRPGIFYG